MRTSLNSCWATWLGHIKNDEPLGQQRNPFQIFWLLAISIFLLPEHLVAQILPSNSGGVQASAYTTYNGTASGFPNYSDEKRDSFINNGVAIAAVSTPGFSGMGSSVIISRTDPIIGTLNGILYVRSEASASSVPDYYIQGSVGSSASASFNPANARYLTVSRGSVSFQYLQPDTVSFSAGAGFVGGTGREVSFGTVCYAAEGSNFLGKIPSEFHRPLPGTDSPSVGGAPPLTPSAQTVVEEANQNTSNVNSLANFTDFNHFFVPIEDSYGRTEPVFFARQWSASPEYLFTALDNSVTSIVLPNATQSGDASFQLSFGDFMNPTTVNLLAGSTINDFGAAYPGGIPWFILKDVTTDLNAPINELDPFVLGATFANNGLGELKSWELSSVPEPTSLFLVVFALSGTTIGLRRRTRSLL